MTGLRIAFPTRRRLAIVAAIGMATLSLAACAASASSPAESVAPSQGAPSGPVTVTIAGRSFGGDITIAAGSSVTFVNGDVVAHTVTNGTNGVADADALFDQAVDVGASSDPITFDTAGQFNVTCKIHRTMHLTITVQ